MKDNYELSLKNPYFARMIAQLDGMIKAAPAALESKDAEDATITLKLKVSVVKQLVKDPDTIDGLRLTKIPEIKYKLKTDIKSVEELEEKLTDGSCELIEADGKHLMIPKGEQLSMFEYEDN